MGYSDFLFARPSFIGGMARVIDIGSTLNMYNESGNSKEADFRAMRQDWEAVGSDLHFVIEQFGQSINGQKR